MLHKDNNIKLIFNYHIINTHIVGQLIELRWPISTLHLYSINHEIRNLGILRFYFNMFYTGLILRYKDHINILFQTRKTFEKFDGRKVQFICITNNQRSSKISTPIDFYKLIIALNYI